MSLRSDAPPPGHRRLDRLLLAWLLSLALAFGALAAIAVRDSRILEGAAASPAAALGSPSPTVTAAESPAPRLTIEERVAAVEEQMPAIRGLAPLRSVPTDVIAPSELPAILARLVDDSYAPAQLSGEQDMLVRLGLATAGVDLRAITIESMSSQVLGFYEPATKAMTIVNRGGSFGLVADFTVAHEYTHALQDQHFDLLRMGLGRVMTTDRTLALQALVEGDASLAGQLWMTQHAAQGLSISDLLDLGNVLIQSVQPVMPPGAPAILQRETLFPYLDGLAFVQSLYADDGWSAVDAAYARPPVSTSEVFHPERYREGWRPATVTAPDLGALGPAWHLAYRDTLGELGMQEVLNAAGSATAVQLAAAWDGDQVASWDGPGGSWALVWETRWSSAADAHTFGALWPAHPTPATSARTSVTGDTTTLLLASDPAVAAAAAAIALGE